MSLWGLARSNAACGEEERVVVVVVVSGGEGKREGEKSQGEKKRGKGRKKNLDDADEDFAARHRFSVSLGAPRGGSLLFDSFPP